MWKSILILLIYLIYLINSKLIITDFDYHYTRDGVIIRCLYDNGINEKNDKVQFLVNNTLIWSYDQNKTKQILNDKIDGAKLDIDNSNSTHLALKNIDRKITGMFSCVIVSVRTIENTKAERKFKFDTPNSGYLKQKLKINRPYHELNESYKENSMKNNLTFKSNIDNEINYRNSIYNIRSNRNNFQNSFIYNQTDRSIENRIDKQKFNNLKLNRSIDNEFVIIKQKELNQNKQDQWSKEQIENEIEKMNKLNLVNNRKKVSYENNYYNLYQINSNDYNQNDQFNRFKSINNDKKKLNIPKQQKLANLITMNSDEMRTEDRKKLISYKSTELDSSREIPLTQQEIENSNEIIKREYLSYWTRINFIKLYSEIINIKRRIGLMPKFNPQQP